MVRSVVRVGVVVVLVELENLEKVVQEDVDRDVESEVVVEDRKVAVSLYVDLVDVCCQVESQVDMLVDP